MAKSKGRAVPVERVFCDDLQITDRATGEVWLDRVGQWVDFRASTRWSTMRQILVLSELGDKELTLDHMDSIQEVLGHIVRGWNWDDEDGKPYPQDVRAVVGDLELEEIMWLLSHAPGVGEKKGTSSASV